MFIQYIRCVQYVAGISWLHQGVFNNTSGDIMIHVGDIMSTSGGYHDLRGEDIMSTSGVFSISEGCYENIG